MDNTLAEIVKDFNHIVREFLIYFISGFIVFLNILVIDYFYYDQSYKQFAELKTLLVLSIIPCYILGHICMAFYEIILERTKLNDKLKKLLKYKDDNNEDNDEKERVLPKLYERNKTTYIHFIERYDNLALMRWNLSATFFVNFIVNLVYIIFNQSYWQIRLLMFLFFLFSIIMYLLHLETEKDYHNRIGYVNKLRRRL